MMRKFNLFEAMHGAAICTRNGLRVRLFPSLISNPKYPVVGIVQDEDGVEEPYTFTEEGYIQSKEDECELDLFLHD